MKVCAEAPSFADNELSVSGFLQQINKLPLKNQVMFSPEFKKVGYTVQPFTFSLVEDRERISGARFNIQPFEHTRIVKFTRKGMSFQDTVAEGNGYFVAVNPEGEIYYSAFDTQKDSKALMTNYGAGWIIVWIAGDKGLKITQLCSPKAEGQFEVGIGSLAETPLLFKKLCAKLTPRSTIPLTEVNPEYSSLSTHGIVVPMVTPAYVESNNTFVDRIGINNLVRYLIDNGVAGIFAPSTAGEFQSQTQDQKKEVLSAVIEARNKYATKADVPVYAGVSAQNTKEMIELARFAENVGADAVVLAPLYGEGTVWDKIGTLLGVTELPIVLYNNPDIHQDKGDNGNIPFEDVVIASKHPRIIAMKDSSRNPDTLKKLLSLRSDKFHILTGNTILLRDALKGGADGCIPIMANVEPRKLVELYSDQSAATQSEIVAMKSQLNTPQKIKAELKRREIISSDVMFQEN